MSKQVRLTLAKANLKTSKNYQWMKKNAIRY